MMTFENLQALFIELFPNGGIYLDEYLRLCVYYRENGRVHEYQPQPDPYMYRCAIKTSITDIVHKSSQATTYYYNPNRHNEYTALAVLLDLADYDEIQFRFGDE